MLLQLESLSRGEFYPRANLLFETLVIIARALVEVETPGIVVHLIWQTFCKENAG